MKWQSIDLAPKTGVFMDLWANGFRYSDCFWSDQLNAWVRRVQFVQKDGSKGIVHNHVVNPSHFLIITAP